MGLDIYKHIFENHPESLILCDASFIIKDANTAFESLIGLNKSEIIEKSCSAFIKLEKNNCPICNNTSGSSFIPDQYAHIAEIIDSLGHKIPARINHKIIENNNYISVITPLSEIAILNQAHLDFVSTVSHELRTPLTSIKGFADTLITAGDKLSDEQQKRFIYIIKSQVDRLSRLVENLLTVSRLEGQKFKTIYKAIDFNQFIKPVLNNVSLKAQDHIIKLDISSNLPPVWADSDKLEQIMTNLIDNAIKYSNKGTVIELIVGLAKNDQDFLSITVKDNGVGIPKEFLPKIFTKFSRLDNPLTRQVEGTGLGLYITKSLVESMGGNIFAFSEQNGSSFTLKMPIATPERHAKQRFMDTKQSI